MSYNILKKNVRFSGDSAGTIEGMVDTSTNQDISGSKEFEYLTGSNVLVTGSLVVDGELSCSNLISHLDDDDTKISFGTNSIIFQAAGDQVIGIYGDNYSGGSKLQLSNNSNLFITGTGKLGIGTSVTVDPDHELVVTGTIGVAGQITCSLGITASEFHGDGSNLSGIEPTAANIVGTLSASQIDFNSPLQDNGGNLDVSFASNRGIVDDSGVALDVGNLSSTTTYADTLVMPVSGSGATGNRKMTFGVLEANMNFHLTNSAGTLPNARLPSSISVTNLTASSTGHFNNVYVDGFLTSSVGVSASVGHFDVIRSNLIPETTNAQYLGAPDLSLRWANVASVAANFSGLAVIATGAVSHRFGIGTLSPNFELEVTGNAAIDGYVSASLHVSASEYATAGGTVIDAEGNFQGNNASFNEITASGVVSSSAEYLGDGSKLKKVKYVTLNSQGNMYRHDVSDPKRFWSSTGTHQHLTTSPNDSFRASTTFIAPCSGTVRQVSFTTFGANTGDVKVSIGLFKNGDYTTSITEATGNLKPSGGHGGRQLPVLSNNFTNTFDMLSGSGTPLATGSANVFVSGTVPFAFDPNDSVHFGFQFEDGNNFIATSFQVLLELDDSNIS